MALASRSHQGVRPARTASASRSSRLRLMTSTRAVAGDCVLQLSSSGRSEMTVGSQPKGDLAAYVKASPAFFGALEMPLGGSLKAINAEKGVFELTVPRIQLFDLWIQPRAIANIRVEDLPGGAARLAVTASECKLLGSRHVEQFKLNERFVLDVAIQFVSEQPRGPGTPGAVKANGKIGVKVDIPPPFSFMPQPVLQSTGNTALNSTVSILLNAFVSAMVKDYARWSKQQLQATANVQKAPRPAAASAAV